MNYIFCDLFSILKYLRFSPTQVHTCGDEGYAQQRNLSGWQCALAEACKKNSGINGCLVVPCNMQSVIRAREHAWDCKPKTVISPQEVFVSSKTDDCMTTKTNSDSTTIVLTHNHKRPVRTIVKQQDIISPSAARLTALS